MCHFSFFGAARMESPGMDYLLITEDDETYHRFATENSCFWQQPRPTLCWSHIIVLLYANVLWDVTRKVASTFGLCSRLTGLNPLWLLHCAAQWKVLREACWVDSGDYTDSLFLPSQAVSGCLLTLMSTHTHTNSCFTSQSTLMITQSIRIQLSPSVLLELQWKFKEKMFLFPNSPRVPR